MRKLFGIACLFIMLSSTALAHTDPNKDTDGEKPKPKTIQLFNKKNLDGWYIFIQDRGRNQNLLEAIAGVVQQVAGREIVAAVDDHQVAAVEARRRGQQRLGSKTQMRQRGSGEIRERHANFRPLPGLPAAVKRADHGKCGPTAAKQIPRRQHRVDRAGAEN